MDLEVDNYTLEVSSAGAEREIRFPNDLERFKGLPLKIRFNDSIKEKDQEIIAKFVSLENDDYVFEEYFTKKQKKNFKLKTKANLIKLKQDNIKKINLYLDI
jgi:ribosome maturation factor RimP